MIVTERTGTAVAEKKIRRTQAERSSSTRKALLDATIKALVEHGYGATTTILVAQMAGVSRGAMLHQFPSKAELMAYVVEAAYAEAVEIYNKLLEGVLEPRERLLAYPEAVWQVESRPAGIASVEIIHGSRSDPELAAMLSAVEQRVEANALAELQKQFRGPASPALLHLIVSTMRGLAITNVITPHDEATAAIRLLRDLLKAGLDAGILKRPKRASSAESTSPASTPSPKKRDSSTPKGPKVRTRAGSAV